MSKNLYRICLPRKIDPRVKPYWDLVRAHAISRKKMVDFICGIGGYSSHGERFAIEFNVKAYHADTSFDHLWELLVSGNVHDLTDAEKHNPVVKATVQRVYDEHKDNVDGGWFGWGLEEAYDGWKDSDTPYETWIGERVNWSFGLYGRGGGHLCMEECEGLDLRCSPEELEERLLETEDNSQPVISADVVRKLFIICVQNSVELTPRKASEAVEYSAAWRLWTMAEGEIEEAEKLAEQREELTGAAEEIMSLLVNDGANDYLIKGLTNICKLAGLKVDDGMTRITVSGPRATIKGG
jgi:hypothetical protein